MADTTDSVLSSDTNNTSSPESSFLDASSSSVNSSTTKTEDILYNDFFQENSSGDLTIGAKKERSGIEITVIILQYTTTLVVIL
jgi:hypothetical protein